ncbi:MAG: HepT-like ribonuclease domain-containing protein [Bacteroidota bacterium]
MPKDQKKYLFDILDSIELIESYLEELDSWEGLQNDQEKADAVQRRMGIIGEALYRLRKLGLDLPQSDWTINLRNTLVHQYDQIGMDTLWYRVKEDLPKLKDEVSRLL